MKKKNLPILLVIVALLSGLNAQAKFGIGPKVGVSINKLHINGLSENFSSDNRAGITAGITAEYIAPVLGIGADISLMYMYQQTSYDIPVMTPEGLQTTTSKIKGNFFEIPLHLKYQLSLPAIESIIAPYIFTGPSVAFKLGGKDSYGNTKSTQWGWDVGLGLTLIKHLQIGAGYTFGINNIAKHWQDNTTDNIKIKNNYWTVTAAWMF